MGLREAVWVALRDEGPAPVTLLATRLDATPEDVLAAMLDDMVTTPQGQDAPPVYCQPGAHGPTLVPRYQAAA
jgi:hypothetical protein